MSELGWGEKTFQLGSLMTKGAPIAELTGGLVSFCVDSLGRGNGKFGDLGERQET